MSFGHYLSYLCTYEYWAGLYAETRQEQIIEGINSMLRVTKRILKRQKDMEAARQLQGGGPDEQDNASI
jgi:hypothetical protein